MGFLEDYAKYTSTYEAPGSFWLWSSFTTLGALMRSNVYIKYGVNTLYPNIYTLLLAESAMYRKGAPITLAEKIIFEVGNTKLIAGRGSIQAIIEDLGKNQSSDNGVIVSGGGAIFLAPELAAALVQDRSAIDILTDIYDFKAEYTTRLKGSGNLKAKNIVFSMLSASNIDMLDEMFTSAATYGGLLGRTFVVKPDETRPANDLLDYNDTNEAYRELIVEAKWLIALKGEMKFSNEAKAAFSEWYKKFRHASFRKKDKTGVLGRLHTGVIKLSMLLSINDRTLVIQETHILRSIEYCTSLIPNYKEFLGKNSNIPELKIATLIINALAEHNGRVAKRDLIAAHWEDITIQALEDAVIKLQEAGFIKTINANSIIIYELTGFGREQLMGEGLV